MAWFNAEKSFLKAVRTGDLDGIRKGLKKGISPNAASGDGRPALVLAAFHGQSAAALLLLKSGADVNGHSGTYVYALHEAAHKGDLDLVRALISAGADVNVVINSNGRTALHWAVDKGFTPVVEDLLKAGARADIPNNEGCTALDMAPSRLAKIMEALVAAQPAPAAKNSANENRAGNETWELAGAASVAQVFAAPALGRRLTAVFNFEARERVLVFENLTTGAETMSPPEKFDTLEPDMLKRAEEKFRALGGKPAAARQLNL